MFINELLFAVTVKNGNVAVKTSYHALELEAVGKDDSYHYLVLSALIEEYILQIDSLVHTHSPDFKY